jgi:hypothetical protein
VVVFVDGSHQPRYFPVEAVVIARSPACFRNKGSRRYPLCSSGEVISLANGVSNGGTTWGKKTSHREYPPPGVFEEWARRLKCSVNTVRALWEKGVL